jgi:hypothetical protein
VAGSNDGQAFVNDLAHALGNDIDVAASTDRTGPTALGGDWDLEYSTGAIETVLPFTLAGMQDLSHCLGCLVTGSGGNAKILGPDGTTQWAHHYNYSSFYGFVADVDFHYNGPNSFGSTIFITAGTYTNMMAPDLDFMNGIVECSTPANTAPTFTSTAAFSVSENATNDSTTLLDVNANDGDGGATDTSVTYSITGGTGASLFTIDSTGAIKLNATGASTLNYESATSYTLTVRANDGQSSNNTTDQTITVTITNEAPSVTAGQSFTVAENTATSTVVGTVAKTGDTDGLTWSIQSGNTGNVFAINSSTGQITVNGSLDYETTTTYTLSIRATDGTTPSTQNVTINVTNVNEAPVNTKPGAQTTNEDTALVFSSNALSVADQDAGTTLTTVLSIAGGTGSLHVTTGGGATITSNDSNSVTIVGSAAQVNAALASVTYTPTANANGAGYATLTMSTTDNGTGTLNDTDTVTINVTAVNDTPSFTKGADQTVSEDAGAQTVNGWATGLNTGATDEAAQTLNFVVSNDNNALFSSQPTIDASGNLTYTAATNASGTATVTVQLHDSGGTANGGVDTSNSQTFTITVNAVNDAPTATGIPASITVAEDVAGNVDLSAITFGDVDSGSSNVTFTIVASAGTLTASSGGSVTVGGSGSGTLTLTGTAANIDTYLNTASNIQYTGAANAYGNSATTLTLSANDGGHTGSGGGTDVALGTVAVNITAVADTPSITSATTTPGTQTSNGLVISRNAADGAEVTYFQITNITNGTLYQHDGTTQINDGDFITYAEANSGLRFTPSGSSNGSFDLEASTSNGAPGLGGSVVTATITVGVGVDSPTINEDTDSGAIAISGDTAYYKITSITGGTLYSDAGYTTPITSGSFIATAGASTDVYFRPNADFNGAASFSVQGSSSNGDAGLTGNTAASTITVSAVNDTPTLTVPSSVTVTEDVASAITGISFADVDAGSGSVTATLAVDSGTLVATNGGGVTVAGSGTASITLTGSITSINTFISGNHVTFTSATDATAAVTLTSSINDGGNTGSGGAQSASDTTTLNITAVNDAPTVSVPGSITVTEDVAGAVTGISFADVDAGSSTVTATLAIGSGTLAATSGGGVTVGGTATSLTLTGTIADINTFINDSHVTFTTATNATSAVTLTATINDGGHTGSGGAHSASDTTSITVTAVNDAPTVTVPSSITVTEDVAGAITGISFADIDAGSSTVTATLAVDSGTLAATSSGGVIVGGTATSLTLTGTITDINTFISGSHVTFTTDADATAAVTLTSSINDGGNTGSGGAQSATDTTTLNVTAVNDAPTVSVPGSITVTEDVAGAVTGISFADVDAGSSSVTATLAVGSGTLTATSSGGVTVGGTATSLTLTGTIADINTFIGNNNVHFITTPNATSAVTLTATINDGGHTGAGGAHSASDTTTINVTAVNDAPVAGTIGNQSASESLPFTFTLPAGSFSDPDAGDHLTYTATLADGSPLPAWLSFDPATRTFSGTPGSTDLGTLHLRVTATDDGGLSANTTFSLQVAAPVIPPIIPVTTPPVQPPATTTVDVPIPTTTPPTDFLPPQSAVSLFSVLSVTNTPQIFAPAEPSTAGNSPLYRPDVQSGNASSFHVATAPRVDTGSALIVNHGMADTQIPVGGHTEVTVPFDAFAHTDPDATVTLTLRQADGRPLPGWARFNPATGKLVMDPPPGFEGRLTLRLIARDNRGHEAVTTFKIVVGQRHAQDSRASLNTQLQDAIRPTGLSSQLATLAARANDVLRLRA